MNSHSTSFRITPLENSLNLVQVALMSASNCTVSPLEIAAGEASHGVVACMAQGSATHVLGRGLMSRSARVVEGTWVWRGARSYSDTCRPHCPCSYKTEYS